MTDRTDHDHDHRPEPDADDELLGAYALDAVDADERDQVERRLAESPSARTEVDRLTNAMDHVVDAQNDAMAPPADLWDRIADQLPPRPERIPAPSSAPASPPVVADRPTAAQPSATPPTGAEPGPPADELAARRARRVSRPAQVLLAVAAAVLVVLIGVGVVRRSSSPSTTLAQQLQQQADRVATQPGSRTATLTGSDPSVSIRVVIDADGRGYVEPSGLPALDAGQTYQLWSVDGGTPISLGLLGSDPTVAIVGTGTSPSQLAITAEPAGGSTGPTSNPVAVGTVA